jgi:translation initiation factor 1A
MPVKSKKGGKNVKRGKKGGDEDKRELVFKEDGQEYAQVVRMLGNCRLEAFCFDGTTRLAHIRGKMRKKLWVNAGDIVLIGLRDYQDAKCDVIHKYKVSLAKVRIPRESKKSYFFADPFVSHSSSHSSCFCFRMTKHVT